MKRLALYLATVLMVGSPVLAQSGVIDLPRLTWPETDSCSSSTPCEPSK